MKILIVEDMEVIRTGIMDIIRNADLGHIEMTQARNGEEGLACIKNEHPDLIITDIKMPIMDGLTMMEEAQRLGCESHFLVITGFAEFEYAQRAVNLGAKGLILKPINEQALLKHVTKLFMEKKAGDKVEEMTLSNNINRVFLDREREDVSIQAGQYYALLLVHFNKSSMNRSHRKEIKEALKKIQPKIAYNLSENYTNYHEHFLTVYNKNKSVLQVEAKELVKRLTEELEKMGLDFFIGLSRSHRIIGKELYEEVKRTMVKRLYKNNVPYLYYDAPKKQEFHHLKIYKQKMEKYLTRNELDKVKVCMQNLFYSQELQNATFADFEDIYHDIMELGADTYRKGLSYFETVEDVMDTIYENLVKKVKETEGLQIDKGSIEMMKEYLDERVYSQVSAKDIAGHFNISNSYFTNLFKKHYDETPNAYITGKRIKRACHLLKETEGAVSDIAELVGYQDAQYFYRVFKKVTGDTPLKYRMKYSSKK